MDGTNRTGTGQNAQSHRLRSLIFESLARTETFGTLIQHTDATMRLDKDLSLQGFIPEFDDASDALKRTGSYGRDGNEIAFAFDHKARLTETTASFVSLFRLGPGDSLHKSLGESARSVMDALTRGHRSQAAFTLFTHPRLRPVPIFVQAVDPGRFRGVGITLRWTDALAPVLKSGYQLTDTEIDVVELLFLGHMPKEIAALRQRSPETVRTQIRKICAKTDTHGHADILHLIYGLIATTHQMRADQTAAAHGNFMLTLPGGRRMDVECSGPDGGKPLLFLHGCLGGRRLSDSLRSTFSDRRIIAPGRPGHGQTQADDSVTLRDVAQDLFHVLDHFGIRTFDILSYDLGAPFALQMAALQPDRIASLTCLAPVPPLTDWHDIWSLPVETRVFSILSRANPSAAHYLALLGGQRILREGAADFGKIVFANSPFDREQIDADETAQTLFWHGHAWHVERGPSGFLSDAKLSSTAWSTDLPRLKMPIRFLVGEHDKNAPPKGLKKLAEQVDADVLTIPGAGHGMLHTGPEIWSRLLALTSD